MAEELTKAHPHVDLMQQYVDDARETDKPWERWEIKGQSGEWIAMTRCPNWVPAYEYRRKPRTININGYEVPEPLREAPGLWVELFCPVPSSNLFASPVMWEGTDHCHQLLERGLLHRTQEAAELHARALLSFTKPT